MPARLVPMTQASIDTRSGMMPFWAARPGLSTTARIATPIRVLNSRSRRPTATSTPTTRMVISW